MQQLSGRNTYTPTDIPHVRCNCGLSLNREETLSVVGLKTPDNNPDAALTVVRTGQDLRVPVVYVQNMRGEALMPTSPCKAKRLLKTGRAVVVSRTPFVLRLKIATGESKQPVVLGVDSGYVHIGVSAVTEKKELYSADVNLRSDIVKLNSERSMYRRNRRSRKTWYRQPRWKNRAKPEGWLAPSIQHKLDSHIKVINQVKNILPVSQINIEVAAFDIQKIMDHETEGAGYQNGVQKDFWNTREYVLYRDRHTCQHCKGKSKDNILEVHHIVSRQIGGDRPDNLITLCKTCHEKVSREKIVLKIKPSRGFRAETFMSMVRWRILSILRDMGNVVTHTYGHITKSKRIALGLAKSHTNDAFVIANGNSQERGSEHFVRQVRKCNRKLFKGDRSHIKNTAPRLVFGYRLWDKVSCQGSELFIKARRLGGSFALSDITGKLIRNVSYKKIDLLEVAKTMLTMRRVFP